jgi:hypothetical protein
MIEYCAFHVEEAKQRGLKKIPLAVMLAKVRGSSHDKPSKPTTGCPLCQKN